MRSALVYRRSLRDRTPVVKPLFPCWRCAGGGAPPRWYPRAPWSNRSADTPARRPRRGWPSGRSPRSSGALATVVVDGLDGDRRAGRPATRRSAAPTPLAGRPPLLGAAAARDGGRSAAEPRRTAVEDRAAGAPGRPRRAARARRGRPAVRAARRGRGRARARPAAIAPDDPRVAAARLTLGYDPASPQATIDAPRDAGRAAAGRPAGALPARRRAALGRATPTTAETTLARPPRPRGRRDLRARRADDLLHPGMAPGLPAVLHVVRPDAGSIEQLQAIAKAARPTDVQAQLAARRRAAGAPAAAPTPPRRSRAALTLDPNVRGGAGRAGRATPSTRTTRPRTFGVLGPLVRDHRTTRRRASHLAVCLLLAARRASGRARSSGRCSDERPARGSARLAAALGQQAR